jgi:nucleoside-diphosphate-sugar epimerase
MTQILITGATGFVGQNLIINIDTRHSIKKWGREQLQHCNINELIGTDAVIHLAGKAHDIKKVVNPKEYYQVNYELTKQLFDAFLESSATVFVFMSSVKAVADEVVGVLTEEFKVNPQTHYGLSKRLAEEYMVTKNLTEGKRVYILRPCMIHGPGNKGNLNLLYQLVSKGIPWPLGAFENKRSFCSIENLMFIINELIEREDIPNGVYNVSDDQAISTNRLIELIAQSKNKKARIYNISQKCIITLAKLGNFFRLPINTERLEKLTTNFVVSNEKIVKAIGKPLPVSAEDGLMKTFISFK